MYYSIPIELLVNTKYKHMQTISASQQIIKRVGNYYSEYIVRGHGIYFVKTVFEPNIILFQTYLIRNYL